MKRSLIFLNLIICLLLLTACSFLNAEQGWTTISDQSLANLLIAYKPRVDSTESFLKKMHQPEWIGT